MRWRGAGDCCAVQESVVKDISNEGLINFIIVKKTTVVESILLIESRQTIYVDCTADREISDVDYVDCIDNEKEVPYQWWVVCNCVQHKQP